MVLFWVFCFALFFAILAEKNLAGVGTLLQVSRAEGEDWTGSGLLLLSPATQ